MCSAALGRWRFFMQQARQLRDCRAADGSTSSDSDASRSEPPAAARDWASPERTRKVSLAHGAPAAGALRAPSASPSPEQRAAWTCSPGAAPSQVPPSVQESFLRARCARLLRRRQLLRRALAAWRGARALSVLERSQLRRASRRRTTSLLLRGLRAWQRASQQGAASPQAAPAAGDGSATSAAAAAAAWFQQGAAAAVVAAPAPAPASAAGAGPGAQAGTTLRVIGEVLPRLAARRLRRQAFFAWRHQCVQAVARRRSLSHLCARRDLRLARTAFAALLAHATRRRAKHAAAANAERHMAQGRLRRALAAWRSAVAASTRLRELQQRGARRAAAATVEAWRAAAAEAAWAGVAEARAERMRRRRDLQAARAALLRWQLQAARARCEGTEERAAAEAARCDGAEERALGAARALALAEERIAAAAAERVALEQVRRAVEGGAGYEVRLVPVCCPLAVCGACVRSPQKRA